MLEFAFAAGIGTIIASSFIGHKSSDKEKLDHIFRNTKFGIGDKFPRKIKTINKDLFDEYVYSVPYGLINDTDLEVIINKTLNKPTRVFFDGKLHVRVYKEKLKKEYPYNVFKSIGGWNIPIGMSYDGIIYHDFDKIPHMTIAGATRWGKTAFLKVLLTHLVENNPDDVEFYILDLKGGLAFWRYGNLKQVRIVAGNFAESAKAMRMINGSINKDMREYKATYHDNVLDTGIKKRKFIIIDEAAELVPNKSMEETDELNAKYCQRIISRIVRVSGSLGYRLLFTTQYPTANIMDNQIKANSSAKLSFRLQTSIQSKVAIDEAGAEKLEYPGRGIYSTVDKHIIQAPFLSNKDMWERLRGWECADSEREEIEERGEVTLTL